MARKRDPDLRDQGTPENRAKRAYTTNGCDPQLVATASGILLANNMISQEQHNAALIYARLHALVFGKAWPYACPLSWELGAHGHEPGEDMIRRARDRIDALNARLTSDQRRAVANVAVYGFIPQFFYASRLKLRQLPSDERERQALLSGLAALAE
jgi:hypothetical protein